MQGTWQVYADTGYPPMDDEHRALSGQVCMLLSCVSRDDVKGARVAMSSLVGSVVEHFSHEERLMADTRFPEARSHGTVHQAFAADASKHARDLQEFGLTPEFQRWAMGHLAEWFHFHILSKDMALARYLLHKEKAVTVSMVAANAGPTGSQRRGVG